MAEIHQLVSQKYPLELLSAWEEAYGLNFNLKYPGRFVWLHLNNPFCESQKLGFFYISVGNVVAAWTSSVLHQIKVGDKIFKGGCAVDTYTMPNFRKQGFWKILQNEMIKYHEIYWSIEMSQANRSIRLKSGLYNEGKPLNFYFAIIETVDKRILSNSALSLVSKKNFIIRYLATNHFLINLSFYFINKALRYNGSLNTKPYLKFQAFDYFDIETDRIWSEVSLNIDFGAVRNSVYLNWRYGDQPFVKYYKYKVLWDNLIIGFFVFRIGDELQNFESFISELIIKDDFSYCIPDVLQFVAERVKEENGRMLFIASSQKIHWKTIEAAGFYCFRSTTPLWCANNNISKLINTELIISSNARWLMSYGDQDMDQISSHSSQPDFITLIKIAKSAFIRKLKKYFSLQIS